MTTKHLTGPFLGYIAINNGPDNGKGIIYI